MGTTWYYQKCRAGEVGRFCIAHPVWSCLYKHLQRLQLTHRSIVAPRSSLARVSWFLPAYRLSCHVAWMRPRTPTGLVDLAVWCPMWCPIHPQYRSIPLTSLDCKFCNHSSLWKASVGCDARVLTGKKPLGISWPYEGISKGESRHLVTLLEIHESQQIKADYAAH